MNCKAAVFDLDGTLLDTLEDLYFSVNRALAHFALPERTKEEVQAFVGNGVEMLMVRAIPSGRENPLFAPCLQYFKEDYALHSLDHTAPYPGIISLLNKLNARGIQCAVVSNKFDAAVKELVEHFFYGLVVCARGERLGIRPKPAPDTVLAVLKELRIPPQKAVYIGDSDVDVLTSQNCCMPCISAKERRGCFCRNPRSTVGRYFILLDFIVLWFKWFLKIDEAGIFFCLTSPPRGVV